MGFGWWGREVQTVMLVNSLNSHGVNTLIAVGFSDLAPSLRGSLNLNSWHSGAGHELAPAHH